MIKSNDRYSYHISSESIDFSLLYPRTFLKRFFALTVKKRLFSDRTKEKPFPINYSVEDWNFFPKRNKIKSSFFLFKKIISERKTKDQISRSRLLLSVRLDGERERDGSFEFLQWRWRSWIDDDDRSVINCENARLWMVVYRRKGMFQSTFHIRFRFIDL